MPDFYPLPTVSPLDDISDWIPILLGAVDAHLDNPAAWDEADWDEASALIEDLRVFLTELPDNLP